MPAPVSESFCAGPNILAVSQTLAIRELIRDCLQADNFLLAEAETTADVIQYLQNHLPALILLDATGPNQTGLALCRWLQAELPVNKTAILVLIGEQDNTIEQAFSAGANDFVTMPINPVVLQHRIHLLLRNQLTTALLAQNQENLAAAQRIAALGSWEWDLRSGEMEWSAQVFDLLDYTAGEIAPSLEAWLAKISPSTNKTFRKLLEHCLAEGSAFDSVLTIVCQNGDPRFLQAKGEIVRYNQLNVLMRGILQDVTGQRYTEERLRFLASFDPLTGLCNRQQFIRQLDDHIQNDSREPKLAAIIHLGLDRFKRINQSLGHEAADALLTAVAGRLAMVSRSESRHVAAGGQAPGFELARWGGDEFVLLGTGLRSALDAAKLARRLLNEIASPYQIDDQTITVAATLGIVIYPNDGDNAIDLLKNAYTAMRYAKTATPGSYSFYAPVMNEQALLNFSLENDLRFAIERDELAPYYQAKVDMQGNIIGAEMLLRWLHPQYGLILPEKFIYLAEESGQITAISEWLLQTAGEQLHQWAQLGIDNIGLALNLSPLHIDHISLPLAIEQSIQLSGVNSHLLELELTEGTLLKNRQTTLERLTTLKNKGVNLAIDDFGTGYSSLSYLARFPIDTVKIDRSFLQNTANAADLNIIRAIIALAHTLNMRVVAEGVETQEQAELLRKEGCDYMQGFLYGVPVPAAEFTARLLAACTLPTLSGCSGACQT